MTFEAAISLGLPLVDLVKWIKEIIEKAKENPEVVKRVLLYLDSVKMEVTALGKERQGILSDVRNCDFGNKEQVNALWRRLDKYLKEDNIRPLLGESIEGLQKCIPDFKNKADKGRQRGDKKIAVQSFLELFDELLKTLHGLKNNFFPGLSGQGVATLKPIYKEIAAIRKNEKSPSLERTEISSVKEKIDDLEEKARLDSSHEEWFTNTAKVEGLITQLKLAWRQ